MKAAIGDALLLGIIVTFFSIVLLVLISSIAYTKAFRIKNKVVDEIEKAEKFDDTVNTSLYKVFKDVGYKANAMMNNSSCEKYKGSGELLNTTSAYHYCVIKLKSAKYDGYYYKVVTFAYLDFPLISAIQIPVYGETKIFYSM